MSTQRHRYGLTIDKFLDHASKWHGNVEVVSAVRPGAVTRTSYATLRERSNRLSGGLLRMGLKPGNRVATLAWNTQHHFEMYFAVMSIGMVCHTLNPRVSLQHLAGMINEADDRALAVGAGLSELAAQLLPLCPGVKFVIQLDGGDFEEFLQSHGKPAEWGCFEEDTIAGVCHTSGTTGVPKGVVYTHRSNYLHTLRSLQADAFALTSADTVLVAVPMFHANGWGFPFAAPAVGAKLVLPGRHADGESLANLMLEESVTIAAGVQTVWLGVLDHLDATGGELPALERVLIGGSACPDALIRRMEQRLGAVVQTSWGMTELSPLGTISSSRRGSRTAEGCGRTTLGLDLKLVDEAGKALPQQRNSAGHLRVKGASVMARYLGSPQEELDDEGYFSTGDLAIIDDAGTLKITGRAKDLVKSGGEWINPAEIEDIIGRLPEIALVAVIGVPHPRWGERPMLIFEPRKDRAIAAETLLQALRGAVPDWWLPEKIVRVEHMPLAVTGKIDKAKLRAEYSEVQSHPSTREPN